MGKFIFNNVSLMVLWYIFHYNFFDKLRNYYISQGFSTKHVNFWPHEENIPVISQNFSWFIQFNFHNMKTRIVFKTSSWNKHHYPTTSAICNRRKGVGENYSPHSRTCMCPPPVTSSTLGTQRSALNSAFWSGWPEYAPIDQRGKFYNPMPRILLSSPAFLVHSRHHKTSNPSL